MNGRGWNVAGIVLCSCMGVREPVHSSRTVLYVADHEDGTISVIDPVRRVRVRTLSLTERVGTSVHLFMPRHIAVAPDGRSVWVTAPAAPLFRTDAPPSSEGGMEQWGGRTPDELVVIDPVRDTIQARVRFEHGVGLSHVVVDKQGRYAYVTASAAGLLFRVDARTFRIVDHVAFMPGQWPSGMDDCDGKVFVALERGKRLAIVDPERGSVDEIPLGGMPVYVACGSDGRSVLVTLYDTREVVRVDVESRAIRRIPLPSEARGPVGVYPLAEGRRAYVADQGRWLSRPWSRQLFEIDLERGTVVATIAVGSGPHGVTMRHDGAEVFVTSADEDVVTVIDPVTRQSIATIPVGHAPLGIACWRQPQEEGMAR